MNPQGTCLICKKLSSLQRSHAIGNSVFRAISKDNSGKVILIDTGEDRIGTTQESYPEYQLCKYCENKLNINFESPVLALLRGQKGVDRDTFTDGYITFPMADPYQIKMYFLAIWLRAAKSSREFYRNIGIRPEQEYMIREAIETDRKIRAQDFPVRLARLKDNEKEFDRDFITCFTEFSSRESRVVFIFGGFSAEIYLEILHQRRREELAVLRGRRGVLRVPVVDIRAVFPQNLLHRYIHKKKEQGSIDDSVLKIIKR